MQKTMLQSGLLTVAVVFAVAIAIPVIASAQSARAHEALAQAQERRDAPDRPSDEQDGNEPDMMFTTQAQDRRATAQNRLDEKKLKVCEKREQNVRNIMARIADRGTKQLAVFTKISDRTQAFYAEKGRTVANYDALVAEVNAQKAAAEAAVAATEAASTDFECDSEDPKGSATSFKDSLQAQNAALKGYKTAVKDLIVGVKSAQSTASDDATPGSDTEGSAE